METTEVVNHSSLHWCDDCLAMYRDDDEKCEHDLKDSGYVMWL